MNDSFVVSDGDDDGTSAARSSKRSKANPVSSTTPSSRPQRDSENNIYWDISKARRVTISDFRGKKMVSIREYYEKDGNWLPGKKGISMTLEQYNALVGVLPAIERELLRAGVSDEQIVRPKYEDGNAVDVKEEEEKQNGGDEEEPADESDGDGHGVSNGKGKANHEATSDEEE